MRIALLVAYDGTNYGGWQVQHNAVTVQQKIEQALEDTLGFKASVIASGRTDSGVHAEGQVCHFDAPTSIPAERFADALNFRLPDDISVLKSVAAPDGFDAQSSAKKKTYVYRVYLSPRRNPLKDRYSVHLKYAVDIDKLRHAATLFEGEHDFKAYCAAGSSVKTTVRRIYSVKVNCKQSADCTDISISVTGNGFLYNMVRTLAGTLIYCAAGRLSEADIVKSLTERNRSLVGKTMPAKGLTLKCVNYSKKIF